MFKKYFNLNNLSTLLLNTSILTFIIAFNFTDNPPGGWYQQFLPNLNGANITDITFTDSLTGYAVTNLDTSSKSYILKTTNGGDNWYFIFADTGRSFSKIQFVNNSTGYAATLFGNGTSKLLKTTDGGNDWLRMNNPNMFSEYQDIDVISENEIWMVFNNPFNGCVYRSVNSGNSWELKYPAQITDNPDRIYMINSRIGFISNGNDANSYLKKTTDAGNSWFAIANGNGWDDIYFQDSLNGLEATGFNILQTNNGGFDWDTVFTSFGGNPFAGITTFKLINNDTIWGGGDASIYFPNLQVRGIVLKTTNGGNNWGYQLPDTSIRIGNYRLMDFSNSKYGWFYRTLITGIHTSSGGDTITYPLTNISGISTLIVNQYKLFQNFPNPFNPRTIINYELRMANHVLLKVYDINGKLIRELVNEKQSAGSYEVKFDGSRLSSGVYFYSLFLDGERVDTKKMILVR